jgi:hypothetical protein
LRVVRHSAISVDEPGGVLRGVGQQTAEAGLVGDGDDRHPVGPQQVCDLVRDGPPGCRCRSAPCLVGQVGHDRVEFVALRLQVGDGAVQGIGHGVTLDRRSDAPVR